MTEEKFDMDAGGKYDYLVRSIAIVTILVENGVLEQLFEKAVISQEEVESRVEIMKKRFPEFAGLVPNETKNHPETDVEIEGG